jgi:hypothetical protein
MASRRYYVPSEDSEDWPPELNAYNKKFAETLERIKRRHDSVVTTVGKSFWGSNCDFVAYTILSSPGRPRVETQTTTDAD